MFLRVGFFEKSWPMFDSSKFRGKICLDPFRGSVDRIAKKAQNFFIFLLKGAHSSSQSLFRWSFAGVKAGGQGAGAKLSRMRKRLIDGVENAFLQVNPRRAGKALGLIAFTGLTFYTVKSGFVG